MNARERAASRVHVDPAVAAAMISQYREAHALSAITPDPILQKLAQAQADAMAAHNILSHTIAGTLTARFDAAN
ncbi:MAG: CAP domain-containing protein, partial [Methylovirgula sp.]